MGGERSGRFGTAGAITKANLACPLASVLAREGRNSPILLVGMSPAASSAIGSRVSPTSGSPLGLLALMVKIRESALPGKSFVEKLRLQGLATEISINVGFF